MSDPLGNITRHAAHARDSLTKRDAAIVAAREAGATWRAIAAAAGLTEHGCRKIAARVAADQTQRK